MPIQFHRAMDMIVMRAVEHGFVRHFQRRCMAALAEEFSNSIDSGPISTISYYEQGSMEDLHFALYCFAIGIGIAFFSFIGEFLVFFKYLKRLCKKCRRYTSNFKKMIKF